MGDSATFNSNGRWWNKLATPQEEKKLGHTQQQGKGIWTHFLEKKKSNAQMSMHLTNRLRDWINYAP